jgi:hypothetical protein
MVQTRERDLMQLAPQMLVLMRPELTPLLEN